MKYEKIARLSQGTKATTSPAAERDDGCLTVNEEVCQDRVPITEVLRRRDRS